MERTNGRGKRLGRAWHVIANEASGMFGWHRVGAALVLALPQGSAGRARAEILARCGWPLGRGVTIAGLPRLAGSGALLRRLRVGDGVFVNVGGYWELNERIDIGDGSSLGHEVMILTTTHRLGEADRRAAELRHEPVRIGSGVWIGSRSTILPGVTIGDGAVVAAGTVVGRDVPRHAVFGVEPAGIRRCLTE